jgi:hypothetical protein
MQTPSVKAFSLLGCLDRPLEDSQNVQSSDAHTVLACFFLECAVAVATYVGMTVTVFQSLQGGRNIVPGRPGSTELESAKDLICQPGRTICHNWRGVQSIVCIAAREAEQGPH